MYIDDIVMIGDNLEEIERPKKTLTTSFEVKELEKK